MTTTERPRTNGARRPAASSQTTEEARQSPRVRKALEAARRAQGVEDVEPVVSREVVPAPTVTQLPVAGSDDAERALSPSVTAEEHEEPAGDPEAVPIMVALARVMRDVAYVRKDSRNTHFNFNFRGIDAVTNALGPAMRRHGVIPFPQLESYTRSGTGSQRETLVQVRVEFHGPMGDVKSVLVPGEALDSQDKGTAKAMSVAMRIALLQTFALPTDEPDPDSFSPIRETPAPAEPASPPPAPAPAALSDADAHALGRSLVDELAAVSHQETYRALWARVTQGPIRRRAIGDLVDAETRQVLSIGDGELNLEEYARAVGKYAAEHGTSVRAGVDALYAPAGDEAATGAEPAQ